MIKLRTVKIRSRHPSHNCFRNTLQSPYRVLIRLGSTTVSNVKWDIELNTKEAIAISSNKLKMKECFTNDKVSTAPWIKDVSLIETLQFPVIAKHIYGSRGTGNYKLNNLQEFNDFIAKRRADLNNFIFEQFLNYAKEYRIHVSTDGVFLMWRKLRRLDTPDDQKWFFNNENCNWVGVNNDLFDKPKNLDAIIIECEKALKSVGLDFAACDVRVQSNVNADGKVRENPAFAIIEINSAPSMAEQTAEAYIEEFMNLIVKKKD